MLVEGLFKKKKGVSCFQIMKKFICNRQSGRGKLPTTSVGIGMLLQLKEYNVRIWQWVRKTDEGDDTDRMCSFYITEILPNYSLFQKRRSARDPRCSPRVCGII